MEKVLVENFLDFLQKDKKLSDNTLQSYNRDIKLYCNYMDAHNIDPVKTSEEELNAFNTKLHNIQKAVNTLKSKFGSLIENIQKEPTIDEIIDFIEALYNCVQFSSECVIIGMIYIDRIIALTGLSLQNTNWRPLIFVSLMMSQNIWDDRYLSNGDFSSIYPFFEKEDLNLLEMKFLEIIQYNVFVKLSIYMTFYLELRILVKGQLPLKPLNKLDLKKMEHLIGEKRINKLRKDNSHGKFLKEGERSSFVIN